jgi:hypothetical protein
MIYPGFEPVTPTDLAGNADIEMARWRHSPGRISGDRPQTSFETRKQEAEMHRIEVNKMQMDTKVGSSSRFCLIDLIGVMVADKQSYVLAVVDDMSKECLHLAVVTQPFGNNIKAALDRTAA